MADSELGHTKIEHLFIHLALAAKQLNINKPVEVSEHATEVVTLTKQKKAEFVASKNAKVYHIAECVWADNIKPANRVYFKTAKVAAKKGFKKHDCAISIKHHATGEIKVRKLSEHNALKKKLQARINKLEAQVIELRKTNPHLKHQLDILETKIELDKIKLKRTSL